MSKIRNNPLILSVLLTGIILTGCTIPPGSFSSSVENVPPLPLTYLALEKPTEVIKTKLPEPADLGFSQHFFFFFSTGYLPAMDIKDDLIYAQNETKSKILRNVDVELNVPYLVFFLPFTGMQFGSDRIYLNQPIKSESERE